MLRKTLNPAVDNESAVEMRVQHILTAPLFDAMFRIICSRSRTR